MGRRSVIRPRALLALLALGCGAAPNGETSPTAARTADGSVPFESPARWASFPDAVGVPTSTLVLGDGRCLVLTDDGQRWLVTPKDKAKPCAGRATASGSPSLESLLFVEKVANGYRFVGEGGVVYESRDPIGPFERAARAPSYLVRLAAGGSTVVGVDRAGKTFHFEDGTWKSSQAPARVQGLDVAVDASGKAAWIGAPETVLLSSDGGRTFVPPASPPGPVGAWEVMRREDGKLGVLGIGGALVLEGDKFVSAPVPRGPTDRADAEIDPVRGPKESLVRSGVAALTGKTYYEVVEGSDQGRFALLRAELGTAPETIPIAGHESCDAVRIAADGDVVALVCMGPGGSQRDLLLDLEVSTDRGKSFGRIAELSAQTFGDVHLAVAKSGDKGDLSVLIAGACRLDAEKPASKDPEPKSDKPKVGRGPDDRTGPGGCAPKAPVLVRREAGKIEIAEGSATQIEQGSARSPALSPDGRVAYVLARTRRDGRRSLFVSRDGGRTYAQRKLEMIQGSGWDDADESESQGSDVERMLSIPERAELTVDESGTLGLLCDSGNGPIWATLDSDGRVQSSGRPSDGSLQLGGFGSRVLAVGFGADDILHAWESLDGGSSFAEIAVTQAVLRFANRGEPSVACSAGGCVLGDELVRVGWEGQAEAPFEVTEESFSSPDISLSAPLTCRLTPKTEWIKMRGRSEDGSAGPRMPRLRDVARGKTAWSTLSRDPSGKIDVFSAPMPERSADGGRGAAQAGPITSKPLLGAPQGKGTAVAVSPQAEGYVAMRAPVPKTKGGAVDTTAPIDRVELAWHNQFLGVTARRTVRLDENWSPVLVSGDSLRPVLISIAGAGVTVRATGKRATYFDAQSAATSFDYPVWPEVFADRRDAARGDAATLGGSPSAVAFVDRAPLAQLFAIARPRAQGRGFDLEARTIAPGYAELEWIYSGDRTGVAALSFGAGPERADAWMLSDRGLDAEAVALPRLAHVADRVAACSTEKRRSTPRSISPHFTRSGALTSTAGRRAVLVTDAPSSGSASLGAPVLEPIWLLTDGAVLHGSPADPCIAAWKASGLRGGAIAVITGDLEHAWLIKEAFEVDPDAEKAARQPPPGVGGGGSGRLSRLVMARPMSCKIDGSLAVPHEVATRAGGRMPDDAP
jgi:hypothetical protein